MRRLATPFALALSATTLAVATTAPPASALRDTSSYTCGLNDYNGTPARFDPSFAIALGPLALWKQDGPLPFRSAGGREHGWYHWSVNVSLPAEHRATLAVLPGDARRAGLGGHSSPNSLSEAHRRIRFASCPRSEHRKTSEWPVVLITRAKSTCLRLHARVDGGPTRTVSLPLGRRCGAAGART